MMMLMLLMIMVFMVMILTAAAAMSVMVMMMMVRMLLLHLGQQLFHHGVRLLDKLQELCAGQLVDRGSHDACVLVMLT